MDVQKSEPKQGIIMGDDQFPVFCCLNIALDSKLAPICSGDKGVDGIFGLDSR